LHKFLSNHNQGGYVRKITKADLANNPKPKHPGFQDLDLWTEDQLRNYVKSTLEKEDTCQKQYL
tara:strand:+ start:634 stop:825 length:192 start_codon:yes stop_codon:yes gene_type:complete